MIPLNLTALTRATPLIQRKAKIRETVHTKTLQNSIQSSLIVSIFNQISCFILNLLPSTTVLRHFKRRAMAEMSSQLSIEEDQEMETQPICLSSDESEIASPCSSPIPQLPKNVPDTYNAITQLISAQHEQMSLSGTSALHYPITPPTSLISDDENDELLIPIIGNPAQFLPYTPNRHPIPLQLCQQTTPIPDTPESPTPENRGQSDIFRPYDIPNQLSSTLLNNPTNIWTVANGLQNLTLHPHPQPNEWVTGCLVCGKSYDQVIEETVADYLNQTAQPGERVRQHQIKRNAFIDGIQSGLFTFSPLECRKLAPVTTSSTPLITMDKTRAGRDTRCPYSKTKLTKLPSNNSLDKLPPPHFIKYDTFLYINIYIHTLSYAYLYIYVQNPYQ